MKNETVKLAVILCVIAAVAGAVLAFTYQITYDPIQAAEAKASSGPDVAAAVVPGASSIDPIEDQSLVEKIKSANKEFVDLRVCKDESGKEMGYGIRTFSTINGYGGAVEIFLGVSSDGKITGMKVISHKETAGLGSNIEKPKFQSQFVGKGTDQELVVSKSVASKDNEISSLSGATYSSKSITSAVNNAMAIYNEYLKK